MIKESFSNEDKRCFDPTKLKVVVTLAIATSIDALAIGISFAFCRNKLFHFYSFLLLSSSAFTSFCYLNIRKSDRCIFAASVFNLRMELWGRFGF